MATLTCNVCETLNEPEAHNFRDKKNGVRRMECRQCQALSPEAKKELRARIKTSRETARQQAQESIASEVNPHAQLSLIQKLLSQDTHQRLDQHESVIRQGGQAITTLDTRINELEVNLPDLLITVAELREDKLRSAERIRALEAELSSLRAGGSLTTRALSSSEVGELLPVSYSLEQLEPIIPPLRDVINIPWHLIRRS